MKIHPDSPDVGAIRIEVEVAGPRNGSMELTYIVTGAIGDILMPAVAAPERGGELWRHTCFEAFARASSGPVYYEFNFSPSTRWAAYRFDSYRSGMTPADEIGAPRIDVQSSPDCYRLQAALELDRLSGLPYDAPWRLGLSAVIETTDGRMSYWALAHPPGKPDFHHLDCFAYQLSVR